MKNPTTACILSFLLPGAGLWYLGKWKLGFINLILVLAIGLVFLLLASEEFFNQYITMLSGGCAGGSGGLAYTLTKQAIQKQSKTRERS